MLFTYVGFNILRNKSSMAIGELAASVVLVTCSGFLVSNLTGYVTAMWDLVNHGTSAMLVAADRDSDVSPADADKDDIEGAIRDVQVRLHTVFIAEPYDLLQWGSPLQEPCATRRDQILAGDVPTSLWYDFRDWVDGSSGALGTGTDALMGELAECRQHAEFNAEPTWERLGSAILCMGASIAVGLVLTAMAVTMVLGNFVVVMLFGISPFLLMFAALPGSGRRLGWMWLTTLVQAVVVDLGLAFVLSMTLTLMQIVLDVTSPAPDGTGGRPLLERMALLLCLGMLLSVVRSRMLTASQSSAGRFADNMSNVRVGGGGVPWQGPTGSMGVNFHTVGDALERAGRQATLAVAAGTVGGVASTLNSGRLVAAQRMREARMWHNTVKARMLGDQLSLVSDRSYIGSDLSGSASGVMPRGGYPALGPGGPGAGGVPLPVDDDRFAELAEAHPDNLWVKAIEAKETGDQAGFEYYRGMASLHANYQVQANFGGEQRAQEHYEAQAGRLRKKYVQRTDGDPGPGLAVPTPWDVASSGADNLGNPRPDVNGPPIAHLAAAREFGESVRHVPVYPEWAHKKRWLRKSLEEGEMAAQHAAGSAAAGGGPARLRHLTV